MYLSNFKRTCKVISNLFARPLIAPKYFFSLFNQRSPIELKLPWWSYDAIYYVNKSTYESCFEWGSGGSTLFLAKKCKRITTIENDIQWHNKLKKELKKNHFENVNLLYKETNLDNPDSFQNSAYLNSLNKNYDLIVIDGEDNFGPDSTWSARVLCFERAQCYINPSGIIIVDDSWRYPEIEEQSEARSICRFESLGPSRKGVTRTDIHLY